MTLPERGRRAARLPAQHSATVTAEQAFIDKWGTVLEGYGHQFAVSGAPGTSAAEIGAVAAIEIGRRGRMIAVAEPTRRGGGAAYVVRPSGG